MITDPLQQAIERSRALEIKIKNDKLDEMGEFLMQRSAQHAKFREALAIADAALASLKFNAFTGHDHEQDSCDVCTGNQYDVDTARVDMRKLFEDAPHD